MKIFCVAFLLLLSTICHGSTADTSGSKSLLWQISGNGLGQPSYLFGTIHLICPDDFFWTDTMAKYLKAADKVCFEMDLDNPVVLREIMAAYTENSDSKESGPSLTNAQLKQVIRILHDSLDLDVSPGMLTKNTTLLQMTILSKLIRCSAPASYESHIMMDALKEGKEILGLETAAEQLSALGVLKSDSSGRQLMDILHSLGDARRLYAAMVSAYIAQDLPLLYNFMIQSPELKGSLVTLLDDRNLRWIGRMAPVMKRQSTFYAVGAGHLWGNAGIIHLLRQDGYTVTPLR